MTEPTSGDLLRDARRRAHLTQAGLAERAGTTQSVISAYEAGRRQPALSTLASLIAATGFDLDIRIRSRRLPIDRLTGPIGRRVRRHRRQLVAAAAAQGITNLRVFGSVARGEDELDSDVDVLADIPAGLGLVGLGRAREEFERILDAKVDLVPADGLKPGVAKRVSQEQIAL